jgi:hypothetical protein
VLRAAGPVGRATSVYTMEFGKSVWGMEQRGNAVRCRRRPRGRATAPHRLRSSAVSPQWQRKMLSLEQEGHMANNTPKSSRGKASKYAELLRWRGQENAQSESGPGEGRRRAHPDLLRRSIAHRIQERGYGRLPASTRRLLDQLVKAAMAKSNGRLELPRRIKPGSGAHMERQESKGHWQIAVPGEALD